MSNTLRENQLIAVQPNAELRFSHYKHQNGEKIAWAYIVDIGKNPPEEYEPSPLLSILVRGYWEKPKKTKTVITGRLLKAGRNVIDVALERLADLTDAKPGYIEVPWPVTNRPKLKDTDWEQSVIEAVDIDNLLASQDMISRERVEFYIKNPGAIEEGRRAYANVYGRLLGDDREFVIVDGHHRLAALWLLGADMANVWYLKEGD